MALVFVIRNDLQIEDQDNPVRVVAAYPVASLLTIDAHGPQYTMMTVADPLVRYDRNNGVTTLQPNWRDDYKPVLNAEATRRINLAFPEFKQRNYTAQYQDYITTHGADATAWPPDATTFKAEYDRGWQYISDVRANSNSWTGMPTDPTADSIWPPAITPIA